MNSLHSYFIQAQLEAGILGKEAELQQKEAELQRRQEDHAQAEAGMVQEVEDLRRVGTQWKERWQEATVALRTSQDQLEDTNRKHKAETVRSFRISRKADALFAPE